MTEDSRDMHEGATAHNMHDIEFLHNMIAGLDGGMTLARGILTSGAHPDVSGLATDVMAGHAATIGKAAQIQKALGPVVSGGAVIVGTGGSTGSGSQGGGNGNGAGGNGGRAISFDYEARAALTTKTINNLPDSDFAYIEPGGSKDASGKTTPRSLRHFPIHDKAHVQNALARMGSSPFGAKAKSKILAAAKKFGIDTSQTNNREPDAERYCIVPFETEELRDGKGSDGLNLSGYAAVFNSPTEISSWDGDFNETIAPGAFKRSLANQTPVLMFEHGRHPLIGTMPLGVINRASEDSKGLFIEARLSDNWLVQPVRDAVRDGAVSGMSFRFTVPKGGDTWTQKTGELDQRTITQANVTELGPVVFPAYEPTTAQIRSMLGHLDVSPGDLEHGAPMAVTLDAATQEDRTSTDKNTAAFSRDRLLALILRGVQ